MSAYTHTNLKDLDDQAARGGVGQQLEARFATTALDCADTGVSYQRIAPGATHPFGHVHDKAEEVYVVIAGSGRMKLDDEVIELKALDAVRVAPTVTRSFAAGDEGLEYLAVGPHVQGDGKIVGDLWSGE